ncbi:hypothetical protein CEXT_380771 [Caerostris extrusa]|uniref:Uncharacterized protein n=1 Tax=Caerostris extrusa TaxID=172846 RepID=A0AAV4TN89_CAEEX|nr:hypothetical protein CEXT_380771 [Caerostris extrusa]
MSSGKDVRRTLANPPPAQESKNWFFESVVRSTNYEAHRRTSPPEVSASIDSGQVRSSARHGLNHRLSLALQITNVLTSGYI